MLPVLKEASSRPLTRATQDVLLYCRDKLADPDKLAQKDVYLKEELKVVTDLSVVLNLSIRHRHPALAATFQTLEIVESIKNVKAELKDISQMVDEHGHQLLAHWHQPATGSTPPRDAAHLQPAGPDVSRSASRSALSAHFPANAGT